ncbi:MULTISPECIES: hypothetical protein [unclassified Luteimonas]
MIPTQAQHSTKGPGPDADGDVSLVRRIWSVFRREPVLLISCSYLFISVYGLWDSYWFYRRFDIPILEFMQSSDYFVAGLRRPEYLWLLLWTLLASWLALLPERWRQRHPERVSRIERRWWGRVLLPRRSDWWAYMGLHPETMTTLAALLAMAFCLYALGDSRGQRTYEGGGHAVSVRLTNQARELPGDWRMLGTSSAFVFVWNPGERRAEVLPIDSVSAIRLLGWRSRGDREEAGVAPEQQAPPTVRRTPR